MPPTIHDLGIDRLSVDDQIALAQAIWDSVATQPHSPRLPEAVPDVRSALAHASSEVTTFVAANHLTEELELAVELVNRLFPSRSGIAIRIENDPEINDAWIDVRVTTSGEAQKLLDTLKLFSAEWVSRVSSTKRYLIRLSLDVA